MTVIAITHTRPEGTLITGTDKGDGTAAVFAALRAEHRVQVRWGRAIDAWYLPRTRDTGAKTWEIDRISAALRAAGFDVEIVIDETPRPFAEAEDDRNGRADDRVDRYSTYAENAAGRSGAAYARARATLDHIPPGQPVMPDHHSYRADVNRRNRAHRDMESSWEEGDKARKWTDRAGAAAGYQAGRENIGTTQRRIETLEAEQRKDEHALAGRIVGPETERQAAWRRRAEADVIQRADEIAHWVAHVEAAQAAGVKVWGPDDFVVGDWVSCWGMWLPVRRVNKKSLTVPNPNFDSDSGYTMTYPYSKVTGRRSAEDMTTATPDGAS